MSKSVHELLNDLVGYSGIGLFFFSILYGWDTGQMIYGLLGMLSGVTLVFIATLSEVQRDPKKAKEFRNQLLAAYNGENPLKGENQ